MCGTAETQLCGADEAFRSSEQALTQALDGARDRESIVFMAQAQTAVQMAIDAVRDAAQGIQRFVNRLDPDTGSSTRQPADQRGAPRPKTHGRWIGPDGQVHAVVSGEDGGYAESVKAFRDLDAPRLPTRASDVETKLAAYLRNHGLTSATVVIDNVPCPAPFGCDGLVPVLLPPGATLTEHGLATDGRRPTTVGWQTAGE